MRVNYAGCAVCDSTWGDVWAEVEGTKFFFCCEICHQQLRHLVDRTKEATGWTAIDSIEISGDRQGRAVLARSGPESVRVVVAFNAQGELRRFEAGPIAREPRPPPPRP